MFTRLRFATLALVMSLAGCGTTAEPGPTEAASRRPGPGMSLSQVLDAIQAPPRSPLHRTVSKLDVWRTDREPWLRLGASQRRDAGAADLAVLAELWCRREFDGQTYEGHVVAWYVFREGRLDAMDHRDFQQRCAVINEYLPASGDRLVVEREVARRAARFATDPLALFQLYERGLALLGAGRVEDAENQLREADRSSMGSSSFARERLVEALKRARRAR